MFWTPAVVSRRPLGAHAVADTRLYAVARVWGIITILWALFMGAWIIRHADQLFYTATWAELVELVDGHKRIIGAILLTSGVLGALGLIARQRWLSVLSCIVGIAWSGWVAAFLWFAPPNIGAGFAILTGCAFITRFWLLSVTPHPGEPGGRGW